MQRREFQGLQNVCLVPARAVLDVLGQPGALESLRAKARASGEGFMQVLALARAMGSLVPALVTGERLALGLETEHVTLDTPALDSFARQVTADPKAVELAIRLLDQIAGTAPGTDDVPADLVADDRSRSVH
jgi:hypothetical protein